MDRMNTASIVESCRALPGVSVEDREDGASLRLANPEGRGRMDFYPLFPGLTLARIAVEAPSWPAPQPGPCTPEARGPLLINYCLRGRRELILNDRRHVFLTAGQVSLTERFAQKEYLYPGRLYEGVELFLDPETAEEDACKMEHDISDQTFKAICSHAREHMERTGGKATQEKD